MSKYSDFCNIIQKHNKHDEISNFACTTLGNVKCSTMLKVVHAKLLITFSSEPSFYILYYDSLMQAKVDKTLPSVAVFVTTAYCLFPSIKTPFKGFTIC